MSDDLMTIIGARLQVIDEGAIAALSDFNDELADTNSIMRDVSKSALLMARNMEKSAAATQKQADASKEATDSVGVQADATKASNDALIEQGAILGTTTKKHRVLSDAIKDTAKSEKSLGDSIVAAGKGTMGKIGKYGLLAGIGIAYESIKGYSQFQSGMTKLVTLAGVSKKNLPGLSAEAVQLSKQYGINLNDMASGMYRLASATVGLKGGNKELHSMTQSFAQLATLLQIPAGAQTEQLARVFGAVRNAAYKGQLQDVGSNQHIAALFAAATGAGDLTGSDLVSAMGKGILQQSAALHLKLPDALSYIDLATRYAANPSTAGTLVSHTLAMLAGSPSAQGQATEEMFGIDQGKLRQISSKQGIPAAVEYFMSAIKSGLHPTSSLPATRYDDVQYNGGNMSTAGAYLMKWGVASSTVNALMSGKSLSPDAEKSLLNLVIGKAFGGGKQEATFLTAAINPKLMKTISDYITGHATKAQMDKELAITENTPAFQQKKAFADIKTEAAMLGKDITPAWIDLLHAVTDVAGWFEKNTAALKALFGVIGGVVGLGVMAWIGGKAITAYRDVVKVGSIVGRAFGLGSSVETPAAGASLMTAAEMLQAAAIKLGAAGTAEDVEDLLGGGGNATESIVSRVLHSPAITALAPLVAFGSIAAGAFVAARYGNTITSHLPGFLASNPSGGPTTTKGGVPWNIEAIYIDNLASMISQHTNFSGLYSNVGKKGTVITPGSNGGPTIEPGVIPHPTTTAQKSHNKLVGIEGQLSRWWEEVSNIPQGLKAGYISSSSKGLSIAKSDVAGANSEVNKDLGDAATESKTAAKDQQDASKLTGTAATKANTAAWNLNTAATAHRQAAAELKSAAAALEAAIGKIDAGQISSSQLASVVAGLANKGNATNTSRHK